MEKTKIFSALLGMLLIGELVLPVSYAAPPQSQPAGYNDPGVQLNRTREYLERQRIARQIAEDRAKERTGIEGQQQGEQQQDTGEVKFRINEIIVDKSEVLQEQEINDITQDYINKEIVLQDLYTVINKINALYANKGYLTCRAFLPPQTIKNGIVHIQLVEGKSGNVYVDGNKSTNKSYITDRIGIERGKYINIHDLNKDLLLFNGTNDIQLHITMHAGKEPGTTDYVISVAEPQKSLVNVYIDNAGSESSGEWREGLFFTDRSLTGNRDSLMFSGIRSDGTESFSTSYTTPIGRSGTKLSFNYSTNNVEITDGELADLDVEGESTAYGVAVIQPLIVNETMRTEAALEYGHQNSQTDFLGVPWIDDTTDSYTASFSMTNYGNSSVIYQKHGYRIGRSENITGYTKDFSKYIFNGFWQKAYAGGQMLSARLDGQYSSDNYLPSAEQFYIGGMYSVRGYEESYLGGDSGFAASIEYSVPIVKSKKTSVFTFLDYGSVFGDSAFDDHTLAGTGIGIRSTIAKKIYASLTLGIPLIKDVNDDDIDSTRIHFMLNGQF